MYIRTISNHYYLSIFITQIDKFKGFAFVGKLIIQEMSLNQKQSIIGRLLNRTTTDDSIDKYEEKDNDPEEYSRPPELPPVLLVGYKPHVKHRLMNEELSSNIRDLIPPRLRLYGEWNLIYSMEQDGYSLNTLYNKCNPRNQLNEIKKTQQMQKGYGDQVITQMIMTNGFHKENRKPVGYVMVIRDSKGNKFGCYLNEHLRPMDHKRYYGNGECFLWKLEKIERHHQNLNSTEESAVKNYHDHDHKRFKAFMYTGINDNIIYSNHDFIAVGSSKGQNGLYLDSSLSEGISYRCDTFGNEVLNGNGDLGDNHESIGEYGTVGRFKIHSLEIWRVGDLE